MKRFNMINEDFTCAHCGMEIKKADEFFFPASIENIQIAPGKEGVSIILCHPPGVVR